jgi:type II secretory pathway pseudopilin PulG
MKNSDRDRGFTIIEGLSALGIISLAGLITAALLASSTASITKSTELLLFTLRALRAEALIRGQVNTVAVPYWERNPEVREASGPDASSVSIPWYRGEAGAELRICREGKSLFIETPGGAGSEPERLVLLEDLEGLDLYVRRDRRGIPLGVCLDCSYRGKKLRILAAFSSVPLPGSFP